MRALVLSSLFNLVLAVAATAGPAGHARTEALLRTVGVDMFLQSFAEEVGGSDNPMARSFSDISEAWNISAAENFDAVGMFEETVVMLGESLDDAAMGELEVFYASDLGREITAMEVAAQRPGSALVVKTEGTEILSGLIANEDPRLEQLTRLIEALEAVETGLAMAANLNHAVLTGMAASGQLPYALDDAQIAAMVDGQRGMMRGAIQEQLFVSLAYTYQMLSDADLDTYIDFLEDDAGRDFYALILLATEEIISVRAKKFGHRLMDLQATQTL